MPLIDTILSTNKKISPEQQAILQNASSEQAILESLNLTNASLKTTAAKASSRGYV